MNYIKADKIITFNKNSVSRDANSSILSVVQKSPGQKPNIKNPVQNYGFRQAFYRPEYNLIEIGTIEDVESLVRQAFQKKTALMFKEGEKFTSKNKEAIKYIKSRIKQMEYVSNTSWRNLLRETGYGLISRSNYFWVKVRSQSASGGRPIGRTAPVAAYFGMAPEYVTIKKDVDGNIEKYRQEINGKVKEFDPRDVIHFYAYKKPGYLFGTPAITPVKDDIRALRRIEENVELLIYQTLFPIFQYKVGTDTKPATDIRLPDGTIMSEVDYVRGQIEVMPAEGGIVTPERHEIKYIGAEKAGLKAREYLDYFKQRVISGLGMSGVDVGDGDTANRATADSMSRALVDSVKDYQDILEEFINKQVIEELLLESTFKFDVFDDENIVHFKFTEVDTEQQMKENVNAQLMYNGNIYTVNEARAVAGKEPITEEEESLMFHSRVTMTQVDAQANAAMALASAKNKASGAKKTKAAAKSAANSQRPTNQYGTKTGPQASRKDYFAKDSYLSDITRLLKNDILDHVSSSFVDKKWISVMIGTAQKSVLEKYEKVIDAAFSQGLQDAQVSSSDFRRLKIQALPEAINYMTNYVDRFFKEITGKIAQEIDKNYLNNKNIIPTNVSQVIDSIKHRADFIDKTERLRSYNYAKAIGLRTRGFEKASISKDTSCEICVEKNYEIDLKGIDIESVPPFHANSIAKITTGIS
jgi:hypothetical protein